jgi:large subunit ribosomal protein L35
MPKIKTKRAAAKRFTFTGTGKVKARHSTQRHMLTSKPKAAKRQHRKATYLSPGDATLVRLMMPYG